MQLRNASRNQRPGAYREYTGPTGPERPTFVHDDPAFDAEVAVHCAFPSLDMHHPGPGPSEVWKARRKVEAEAAKHPAVVIDCDREDSEQEDTEYPEHNHRPRDTDDHDDHDVGQHGEDELVTFPQCSPRTNASLHRLILTTKDMSKVPRGSTQTEQHRPHPLRQSSTLDEDGDTIMVSPAYESKARNWGPRNRRRLTVSLTKRPLSPPPFASRMARPGEGRPARTVSLGQRPPRMVAVDDGDGHDGPLDSPEILESPVGEDFWVTDIFKPHADWPGPSYINLELEEEEETRITEPFRTYPNWSDLSNGVKFLIFYDLTQKGHSFVRACRMLSLDFGDAKGMIDMIVEQRGKSGKARERLGQADNFADPDWLGRILSEHHERDLVTDSLTDDDIRRGKTFLKFMGLRDVAANLDYYQQSCAGGTPEEYDIPLNHFKEDGWQGLIPHFLVGCREELLKMYFAWKVDQERRRAMSDGELHVRMDAPPGTVNPKKVERLGAIEFWQDFDAKDIGGALPLHPDNYIMELSDGTRVNALDDSVITEQEREMRRAVQGDEALKAKDDWFRGPAPKRWPGDRFSLFNQHRRQREQPGPGQEPTVVDAMRQLGWEVPRGFAVLQNRERQQPDVIDLTQPSPESRAETLANRNRHSWPSPQAHTPGSTTECLATRAQNSRPNAQGRSFDSTIDRLATSAQPSRTDVQAPASDPRVNPLALMEPDQSLDLAINSVLSRYHDHLNEPEKSNRASLSRRRPSLDAEYDEYAEFEAERRDVSTRNEHKKKRIQFDDDSYDDEEESPRKKKSPEKKAHNQFDDDSSYDDEEESPRKKKKSPEKKVHKGARQHGARFDSSRSRGTGIRRASLEDDPTPIQPRQRRNAVKGNPFTEDTHDTPNQTNSRRAGGNSIAHRDDLHPRPAKRTGMADSGPPQPTKVRITNNKSAIKLVPASEYYSNETAGVESVSSFEGRQNSSSPEPSRVFGSGFGYAAPDGQDRGQAEHPGHKKSRPAIPTPLRAGIGAQTPRANGNFQPAHLTSRGGERIEEEITVQLPEAFFALKSPLAPRDRGDGAFRRKMPSVLSGNTHRTAPIPNRNNDVQQSEVDRRETLPTAAPVRPDTREITKSTTATQGVSRPENPTSASEPTLSAREAGKGDMGAGPKDQELNKPQELGTRKPPKKPKTQRKRAPSTKAATKSDGVPGSQPAPPKRQSTTPIPLPIIPGMPMRPPLPRLPDIRNPTSHTSSGSLAGPSQSRSESPNVNTSAGGTRAMSQEIMSEEQIRGMGPKRAELEIYKNRERAKSAAASSSRSSSNGSSNHSNSSPQAATSKKPEVVSAGKTGAPCIEPSSSHYTRETPGTSQQTHRPSQTSMSTHGVPKAQSSPGMTPIPGVLQHLSPTINHNSPGLSRLDVPSRVSKERPLGTSNDRPSPHFSPMEPRSTRNIAQIQESLRMPTTNNQGAATNLDSFAGRAGFGPQAHGIVSPLLNLPGNFGRGHTSNYIQVQDESISRAFNLAKEANFGLRMPDSISGNGGRGIQRGSVPGPAGGFISNPAGPQTNYQSPVVRPPSAVNRNNNRVLNVGPGQPIWSPTTTPNFPQRVEMGQGQSAFLGSPPQFNGFQVPLRQMPNQFTGQQQRGDVFLPQMSMSASSPERIRAQPRPQFQGFNPGHHQASPPRPAVTSLPEMPLQGPVAPRNVMRPPGDIFLNPMGMMNTQPASVEGSLNQLQGPGWVNQRGVDFGPAGHHLQHPGHMQAPGQGRNAPQQGLRGIGSTSSQLNGQIQGMDVNLSGGVGANFSVEDMVIDPRILGDVSDLDLSSDRDISQE